MTSGLLFVILPPKLARTFPWKSHGVSDSERGEQVRLVALSCFSRRCTVHCIYNYMNVIK